MLRILLFLALVALAAAGAAYVAELPGTVTLQLKDASHTVSVPYFALGLGIVILAALLVWSVLRALWRTPGRWGQARRERRLARGRHAITHGLLAIGHGDSSAARAHADTARRYAGNDPLALLLHAQSAQLDGDRAGATKAFRAMAEREDTRLFGLRGLFVEAQRADDPRGAAHIAEEALRIAPGSAWASQAVLGFRCAEGDWTGALSILDNNLAAGQIDKAGWRRSRGVLLTARALELESVDRDQARDSAMEAVKLAPTLVPAAVLASKYQSEAHQIRRSMRLVEAAWLANPHPDLAFAYAHVRLGDSARQRLVRVETLAAKTPGHVEGAIAVARAAIDASEFAKARAALEPLLKAPTQRVAMLMAELERTEHGDAGRARAWTLRAVRALHDPVWTADGYVSDRWRPVSPVTGRLDAFQWQTPLAALPSDKGTTIDESPFEEAMLASRPMAPPPEPLEAPRETIAAPEPASPPATQDNSPPPAAPVAVPATTATEAVVVPAEPPSPPPPPAEPAATAAPPLFRPRPDLAKGPPPVPQIVPIVRAPDDPGIAEDPSDEDDRERIGPAQGQAGGWRGFLSRWSV
jgi:HemY protein